MPGAEVSSAISELEDEDDEELVEEFALSSFPLLPSSPRFSPLERERAWTAIGATKSQIFFNLPFVIRSSASRGSATNPKHTRMCGRHDRALLALKALAAPRKPAAKASRGGDAGNRIAAVIVRPCKLRHFSVPPLPPEVTPHSSFSNERTATIPRLEPA